MSLDEQRRLRVLQVAPRYLPDLGGTETHVREVCRRLAPRAEFDITVLATDRTGQLAASDLDGLVPVIRRRAWPKQRDYYFAPGIAKVIAGGDWDLVHVQGIHTLVPILAMAAARRAGIPYVVTFHTGGHSLGWRSAIRGLQWRALSPLLRQAERMVAVSRFERRLFAGATGVDVDRILVIHNGGELPQLASPRAPVPGRIVSSGRLEKYKGHHRAIAALPLVKAQVPGAHLHILGHGPYEGQLRALAAELGVIDDVTIRSVAPAARTEMAEALSEASVVVALSDYEAHPVAVMEAIALGVPVIGYDVAGIGDLVEDGVVAGLRPGSGPEETAAAIVRSLEGASRRLAQDLPTWDEAAAQLAELYLSVGSGRLPLLTP